MGAWCLVEGCGALVCKEYIVVFSSGGVEGGMDAWCLVEGWGALVCKEYITLKKVHNHSFSIIHCRKSVHMKARRQTGGHFPYINISPSSVTSQALIS